METITWIPEDDLMLKNAVEKGASLESLAKGAVQFSRQFSILELQERWHSLLYDPDVSAEASLRMSELQESVSCLSPMSRRVGVSEGYKQVSGKRKEESVRGQYYAMRKRNCTGPCSSADLDLTSLQNYIGDGGGSQEQLFVDDYFSDNCMIGDPVTDDFEIPSDNCMIGDPVTDDFELPDGDLDFSSMLNAETTSANMFDIANEFQCGDRGSFEGNFASEIMGGVCLNGFVENIAPITANEAVRNDLDHSFDHDNLHKEISHIRRDSGPLFNIKPENVCSGFSPPIPDSVASFSQYPEWGAGNVGPHEDSMKGILPGYVRDCGDGLASSDATFGDFSLEFLFVDDDNEKGMLDGSSLEGLSSMLFSSPYNISDPEESMALDTGSGVVDAASLVGFEVPLHPLTCKVDDSSIALSTTASVPEPQSPYRINGVICCVLNTEDPEIPCNDDSFLSPSEVLPSYVSAAMQHSSGGGSVSTPASDYAISRKASEQGLSHIKEEKEQLGTVASPKMEALPDPNHLVDDDGVKYQIFDSESPELTFEDVVPAAIQCQSVPEEVFMEAEPGKQSDTGSTFDFYLSGQIHVSDQLLPQDVVDGSNKEADAIFMTEIHASPPVDPSSVEIASEFMFSPLTSDQEDQLFEDTDDVPCFSDVETMILDMDLGSCIPDLYSSKEVLRHQYEHSGRAIIRLEQGAYSCIQRAIASRRAFALLYSRHLRHYIKKPEVLLGRTTVDVSVDIDLGRGEGCANKISRRQATIKMDENGSFYMKNLGKCSVLVNSKELKTGQRVKLSSNCLIEISGIQFLFEINQNIVRQHLDEKARRINGNSSKFERLPGRVS
ncbi:hypothetical protein MKX03_021526 [Papaver bracteatum]|nr:hypothetical protein MKX03_021526 [Papaver bracteatum]